MRNTPFRLLVSVVLGFWATTAFCANVAPVANAGADQSVTMPSVATMAGSATDDGLPSPPASLTYLWTQASGPGTATITAASSPTTTISFSVGGWYEFKLTVSDSILTDDDRMLVYVGPVSGSVFIQTTDNIQSIVNGVNTPGTTYVLEAGVHSRQNVVPRAGDKFIGEPGAVMSGASPIASGLFTRVGTSDVYWVTVSLQSFMSGYPTDNLSSSHPNCFANMHSPI